MQLGILRDIFDSYYVHCKNTHKNRSWVNPNVRSLARNVSTLQQGNVTYGMAELSRLLVVLTIPFFHITGRRHPCPGCWLLDFIIGLE